MNSLRTGTQTDACPVCRNDAIVRVGVSYPFVRHSDYTNVRSNGLIVTCASCSALSQSIDKDAAACIRALFGESYVSTGQTDRKRAGSNAMTRSELQAPLIKTLVSREPRAILDIGCNTGALLSALKPVFPRAELHGFDIVESMGRHFPPGGRLRFWSPRLEDVKGEFDVICLSHSLIYLSDLPGLFAEVRRLLAEDGLVFFQMPDVALNPPALLLGDQYHYFSFETLRSLLCRFGFDAAPVENLWFPNEIVAVARYAPGAAQTRRSAVRILESCVSELDRRALALKKLDAPSVTVLGTTFGAAFVDNVLGDRVVRFADEDPSRDSKAFRGKPVVHPRELTEHDVLVIPYGSSGLKIQERFTQRYRGRMVVV